jgi:chromosome segregation ATPase
MTPGQLSFAACACILLFSGCQPRTDDGKTAPAPAGEQAALQARMNELDRKIAALEGKAGSASKATGTGAYAHGTTLRVEGDGRESVLERLRRLEHELVGAQATIAAKERQLAEVSSARDAALDHGRDVGEKVDALTRSRNDLIAAQQTLAERQERIDVLTAQIATSELQRLRAERRWYALAREVLHLTPEDARDLPEMQSRIREATREVREGKP